MQSLGTPLFFLCLKLHLFFSVWFILKFFKTKLPAKRTEEEKWGLELKTSVSLDCWNFQTLSQSSQPGNNFGGGPRGRLDSSYYTTSTRENFLWYFILFYYFESKHFLWWWRSSPDHSQQPPCSQFFPWTSGPVPVVTFSSSQMILWGAFNLS